MKVICFVGKSNKGKTEIINNILKDEFGIKVLSGGKDVSMWFMYEEKKIGMCSYGDYAEIINKLKELKREGCDIIICASHPKGELFNNIKREFEETNIVYILCDGNGNDNEKINKFKLVFKSLI